MGLYPPGDKTADPLTKGVKKNLFVKFLASYQSHPSHLSHSFISLNKGDVAAFGDRGIVFSKRLDFN